MRNLAAMGVLLRETRWLWVKVRRRFETPLRYRRIRAEDRRQALQQRPEAASTATGEDASIRLPRQTVPEQKDAPSRALAEEVLAHRLQLLSSAKISVNSGAARLPAAALAVASELPPHAVAAYRPIEWHTDFHSGYRWEPDTFYLDVRVAPVAGADIKTPRELSRFQHIGALAALPVEQGAVEFVLQVFDWIAANPVRRGVNWACTMDVALRVVNWIWGLRLFEAALQSYPNALSAITASIHEHGRHIEANLEYYEECTSNHYLSDIAGLLYIGAAFPQFPESDRWLLFALQEIVSEMAREVYVDGGDHEASTNYHRLVAELFASCAALAEQVPAARRARLKDVTRSAHRVRPRLRVPHESGLNLEPNGALLPDSFYARLARMAEFTAALTKPNGWVPQFGDNDSARVHKLLPKPDDDVRDHRHLLALVGELVDRADLRAAGASAFEEASLICNGLRGRVTPPPSFDIKDRFAFFPVSGIAVLRQGPAYLAVTCGPNGQGGRGGHGHNDKNSFELNVEGLDFVVDGGCPAYTAAPQVRNRYRSTAAHSTVCVAGEEQDRWADGAGGLFRLPERSAPRLEAVAYDTVIGRHSGFGSLHERRFQLEPGRLILDDRLDDARERHISFNLDPAVTVQGLESVHGEVRCDLVHARGLRLRLTLTGATEPKVGPGSFSVGFGVPVDNSKLSARILGGTVRTQIVWKA